MLRCYLHTRGPGAFQNSLIMSPYIFIKGVVCCLCVLGCQSNNFFLSNVIDEAAYVH